jgi:hypothetical protein
MNFQETIEAAKTKVNFLAQDNTMIRLTSEESSYYIFRQGGKYYIGIALSEKNNPKFPLIKGRPVLDYVRTEDGKVTASVQFLMYVK